MATGFEWLELVLKYSKTVAAIFLFLVSALGWNVADNLDKQAVIEAKEKEVTETREQVTNVAEHFYITTTPPKNAPAVKCTSECLKIINDAILNHEKGRLH